MTNNEIRIHESMTNDEFTNDETNAPIDRPGFDLETRTAKFGAAIIRFAKRIPITPVTSCLIDQLVRSGTSVGANYVEANNAESRKDFHHKIGICRKEAKETMHWLRMVAVAEPNMQEKAQTLSQEAKELNLIFSAIRRRKDA
jgi:four helix bundle protein